MSRKDEDTKSSASFANNEAKSEVERQNDAKRAEENRTNPNLNQNADLKSVSSPPERDVEVKLLRDYVPRASPPNSSGGFDKQLAGSIVTVPVSEASLMCDEGIAAPTRNSFR